MNTQNVKNFIVDSLIPAFCYGCRKPKTYLCEDCFEIINYFPHPICPHCKSALGIGKLRKDCRRELNFNRVFSCADYKDVRIKKLIKDLKYNYSFSLAKPLAKFVYWWLQKNEYADEIKNNINLIVPIPVHKSKLKKRGFNHAEKIAEYLSEMLNIPFTNLLIKTRKTTPQAEIETRDERQQNLKNTFSLITQNTTTGRLESPVVGKNVLLVDDVLTTGSTLSECSKILRKAGAKEIWALTIAQEID